MFNTHCEIHALVVADASDNNTVDIAGLPPGEHKVKIELVDANHEVIPGQSKTVTLTIPEGASLSLKVAEILQQIKNGRNHWGKQRGLLVGVTVARFTAIKAAELRLDC
jgi:hypothetical protein